jgi:hypothetical protein
MPHSARGQTTGRVRNGALSGRSNGMEQESALLGREF